ncbi:MAG TPA: glycosyltransferase [Pirellulales bacterium]|nr:glycosyltransferase [Pirellulales bacterium]
MTDVGRGVPFRMPGTTVVIPCFNEAQRLDVDRIVQFLSSDPPCRLLFVDDGSTDDTLSVLESLQECAPGNVDVLPLEQNQGKAEAVRRGMLAAMAGRAQYAGYWDADLATPLEAIACFRDKLLGSDDLHAVFGARVRMLGRNIQRHVSRHLLGRVFATGASLVLGLGVYDTQCGAKMFRVDARTQQLFEKPFLTNWIFDVELIARMIGIWQDRATVSRTIYEMPLDCWLDVDGSKVRPRDFFRALFDLNRIYWSYLRGTPDAAEDGEAEEGVAEGANNLEDRPLKRLQEEAEHFV